MKNIGLDWEKVEKYIEENIYTLPGIVNHKDELTVVLTGSRAIGCFSDTSDVDIDVICSSENFKLIQKEMFESKKTTNVNLAFYNLPEINWEMYFGEEVGRPHFSIHPIDEIERQNEEYQDTPIWIWTNAIVINDPNNQFRKIIDRFKGYPKDVLHKKIKYRYLLASYWLIDGYPHNHSRDEELFSATLSLLNGIKELYRFFYLVEGKPYPYTEKLSSLINETKLGNRFKSFLNEVIDLAIGRGLEKHSAWERLDKAIELILYGDISKSSEEFFNACDNALLEAGLDEAWVESGYDNIDELLYGKLGPVP